MSGKKVLVVLLLCCCVLLLGSCAMTGQSLLIDTSQSAEGQENVTGADYEFVPFVDTNAASLAYIEIVVDGLAAYRDDGTWVEPERLSDEDAEAVFELLRQISIDTPPLSRYTWAGAPDGGFGAVFNVYFSEDSVYDEPSCLTVIPYPVHLPDKTLSGGIILNSVCFQIDYELYSQLSVCYGDLYRKYYPDIAAKWDAAAD